LLRVYQCGLSGIVLAKIHCCARSNRPIRLRTPVIVQVTDESIRVHVPPFFGEEVPAADVMSVEEVASGLWRRYGAGVGKRYGDRRTRYTVGEDTGVVVERSSGWRIVIGSKRHAELAAAIQYLMRPPRWD
jgi:hypothetical protein